MAIEELPAPDRLGLACRFFLELSEEETVT